MKTRTRTTKATTKAPAKTPAKETTEAVAPKALPAQDEHPPKLFLLPESISKDATIILLHHPRTLKPTRYYHCKRTGFYEIKRIASENGLKRSLLLGPPAPECSNSATERDESPPDGGYVVQTAAYFAVTPIDPLFLLLPALSPVPKGSKEYKSMFLTLDDHIDALGQTAKHLSHVCRNQETLQLVERRLALICDTVTAGEEKMYRLDHGKLLKQLVTKAETMVKSGLPPSMEAHFVKKPLQMPAAHFLQQEEQQQKPTLSPEVTHPSDDSQATTTSSTTSTTSQASQSTTLTTPEEETIQQSTTTPASINPSLRLRVALDFLFSSYIPPHLVAALGTLLSQPTSPLDFAPLTIHLAHLAKLRSELNAQARETMANNSRKRTLDDEEAAAEREEKKRKKEDDERRRKAGESRGVRDLKKVNVTGMRKMSDFFGKG